MVSWAYHRCRGLKRDRVTEGLSQSVSVARGRDRCRPEAMGRKTSPCCKTEMFVHLFGGVLATKMCTMKERGNSGLGANEHRLRSTDCGQDTWKLNKRQVLILIWEDHKDIKSMVSDSEKKMRCVDLQVVISTIN